MVQEMEAADTRMDEEEEALSHSSAHAAVGNNATIEEQAHTNLVQRKPTREGETDEQAIRRALSQGDDGL